MRIYKSDGSFIENRNDTDFGWNIQQLIIDENIPNYNERNRYYMQSAASKNNESSLDLSQSSSSPLIRLINDSPPVIIDNKIRIEPIESIVESQLKPEGFIIIASKDDNKLHNIDSEVPPKQQLASLIHPCTSTESKALLSVVHFAKYKKLCVNKTPLADIIHLSELNSDRVTFIIDSHRDDVEQDLNAQIAHYHATKDENVLSLMMELILSDVKCDACDISKEATSNQVATSDLGVSIEDGDVTSVNVCSSSEESSEERGRTVLDGHTRSDILSSIGLSDVIDRSIQSISDETYDMHLQIDVIRRSFEADENRVNRLIREARDLREQLRETLYLDELLELLNGRPENIRPRNSPFRLLHGALTFPEESINLIV